MESETVVAHTMMQVVEPNEQILEKLDVDIRSVHPGPLVGTRFLNENTYVDPWGIERVIQESGFYHDQLESPLAGDLTIKQIASYPWPDPDHPGIVEPLKDRVNWVRENTDCATMLNVPAPFVHCSQYLRGFMDWYIDLISDPKLIGTLFDAVLEVTMQITKNVLKEVGQQVDIVFTSDDLGAQENLQFSPDHYRKFIKPRHKKFIDMVKSLSSVKKCRFGEELTVRLYYQMAALLM